jgi:CheY-like chemotaxis protein
VILLDIKMPRVTGLEVLEWVKSNEALRRTPVIMLSSSPIQADIDRAYHLGASIYLVKPTDSEEYQRMLQSVCDLFVHYARKPSMGGTTN